MIWLYAVCFSLGLLASWILSYWYFSRKIRTQTKKMVKLMKADELKLDKPDDVFNDDDGKFFADLERASYNLRRKYLRLKKNSADERDVFETIFSGLKEAVVTVDPDLKIISFNSAFMQQFKWAPANTSTNYFLHDVIRAPEVLNTFRKVFEKTDVVRDEFEQYQVFASLLPEVEDNKIWALGVFYDMSEIQKTEKIRVDFVANASHELRTPLTVIRGYADLLHSRVKDQQQDLAALVKPILESTQNMTLLLDDLLDLSKLDHLDKIEKIKLSTREMTESVLTELEPVIVMNHKKIICHFESDYILADESSLSQILRNLIVNATRYSGQEVGSEIIHIYWRKSTSHDRCTELIVQDFGAGIAKEHQPRIFERFYRVDKGRNRTQGGSGLGLALVKHHVLIHGGSIELISDIGQGCKFVCNFPE